MTEALRVLVVDDDEEDVLLTTDMLDEVVGTSYDVTWIRDPEEAIETLLGTERFDVALIDFRMGTLTGLDVLRAIGDRLDETPCILLTGQSDAETDRAAMEAGAADYIVKGALGADQLERSIRYAVEHAATLRSLRDSEVRFRSVVEAATDGIALLGADGEILTCNRAISSIFGADPDQLVGRPFDDLLQEASASMLGDMAASRISGLDTVQFGPVEADGRRPDGSAFPIEVSVSSWIADDGGRLWSAIVRDVTERKALAEQLLHQAFHDPLTGLANRALLRDRVEHGLSAVERREAHVGVLLLDLDNFKLVNDTFGHDVGDELLKAVAARLSGCVRPADTVARLGGDEFAVCLADLADPAQLLAMAERIIRTVARPFDLHGRVVDTTASVGVAVSDESHTEADAILRNADVAMYAAKGRGKNRYEVFEDAMHGALVERMQLEADLREALEADEIGVHYQPVFQLETGTIRGFEALSRWNHPTRGPVSPAVFISIAEESGLIRELGRHVLRKAVGQAATWQRQYTFDDPIGIAVNLSSRQLADPGLIDTVAGAMADSGLAPGTLTLEITESVMMGDVEHAVSLLGKLRDLGVQLALDDFGTGYSSLSYLHLLPLDIVKVDRSFVNRIDDESGAALVRAIHAMGQSLGLQTVAEGVESEDQRDFLTREGYTFGQGFLFAKPLDADEASALLAHLESYGPLWVPSDAPVIPDEKRPEVQRKRDRPISSSAELRGAPPIGAPDPRSSP